MIPIVMQGMGGALYYIRGHRLSPFNTTFRANPEEDSVHRPESFGLSNCLTGVGGSIFDTFWGGLNTWYPIGGVNLKPIAVYNGFIYQCHNALRDNGGTTITRFDGSGVFFDPHNSFYSERPMLHGPGSEFMSPSGDTGTATNLGTSNTGSNDCSMIVHNDVLFIIGSAVKRETVFPNNIWTAAGWNYIDGDLAVTNNRTVRQYFWATIDDSGSVLNKTFGSGVRITSGATTNAIVTEHTHMCDLASFGSNIYGASLCDVFRIHGGSGEVRLMYTNVERPCPKSFEVWPASGFFNGVAQGEDKLLILESSGILKQIITESKFPTGVRTLTDLGIVTTPPAIGGVPQRRTGDPWTARATSSTTEPMRSCVLKGFNKKLHAFFTTATSGYQHVIATGSPSGTSNWSNATVQLPANMKRFDGNLYIAEDPFHDQLIVTHVTMGNMGMLGHATERVAGGGTFVYTYGTDDVWREVYQGSIVSTPRGVVPIQMTGPFVSIPSGSNPQVLKCSDYAILDYKLHDLDNRIVDVNIEYTIDQGASWNTARRFRSYDTREFLGSGTTDLPTTLPGVDYDFYWDYINDLGFNQIENCNLRVRPRLVR